MAVSRPLLSFYDLPGATSVGSHSSPAEASTSMDMAPPSLDWQRIHNGQGMGCSQAYGSEKAVPWPSGPLLY